MSDWSEYLLQARIHLKTAENQLCLAGSLNDNIAGDMRTKAELGLCEARECINNALAAVRANFGTVAPGR